MTVPTRISTRSKSLQLISLIGSGAREPPPGPPSPQGRQGGARKVVLEDLRIRVSAVGHALGAVLGQAHAVPPAAPLEPHHTVLGDRDEERALQGIVPDKSSEVGPPQRGGPARALDSQAGDAKGGTALEDGEGRDLAHVHPALPETLADQGQRECDGPCVVWRLHGKLVTDSLERRHAVPREDALRGLGEPTGVRVLERR